MRGYEDQKLSDQHLLSSLKANKEHYDRNIDVLLSQFNEDGSYSDTFKLFGSKYNQRIKQFEKLREDNTKLKLQTRQLQMQLSLFRNSLQDSGWKDEEFLNKLSMERPKPDSTFIPISNEPSARENIKSRLEQISKLKQQAKNDYSQHFQDYDNLLKEMFKFLQLTSNTKDLLKQMKAAPEGSSDKVNESEMVLVPRKRYELLIELYAATMADKSVQELKKQVQNKPNEVQALEKLEGQQRVQKEKYSTIVKDQDFQLGGLQIFFHRLAQKFGFEKEWERYHIQNKHQAVALKTKIDAIVNPIRLSSPEKKQLADDKQLQEKENEPVTASQLRKKLNSLVEVIPFSNKQKELWSQLSSKIRSDQLFCADRLIQMIKKVDNENKGNHLDDYASLVHSTVSACVEKTEGLLLSKYKKGIFQRDQFRSQYKLEDLRAILKEKMEKNNEAEPLILAKQLTESILQKIFNKMSKHLVFASTRSIHATLRRNT